MNKRNWIQLLVAFFTNGYIRGFLEGKIYTGSGKYLCVPGLNCYSCPGALGACPIGAVQSVLGNRDYKMTYYAVGLISLFGILFGRLICGFLCPFGFVQDLLYKIPIKKINIPRKLDQKIIYLKYIILLVFVLILPVALTNQYGMGMPHFCKWICPAGTLEGAIPLLLTNPSLRGAVGILFQWKMLILLIIVLLSTMIYRPFCKYICPLGALYGLFQKVSFYQMSVDYTKCNGCGKCEKTCKMQVNIRKNINSPECIRCGECKKVCHKNAISSGWKENKKMEKQRL